MAEYEKALAEEEKRRAAREKKWNEISGRMDSEASLHLRAIESSTSISNVIDLVKTAKRKFKEYLNVVRRDLPEYVNDATLMTVYYLSDLRSKGREKVAEIYDKLVGTEETYTSLS
jgi:hypothetical protein